MSIEERTRRVAEALPIGRISATDLHAIFRAAYPDDPSPPNVIGLAFQRAGLLPGRTATERFYIRPETLPAIAFAATVDLAYLGLKPGDPYQVFYGPGEITITPAIVTIKLKKPPQEPAT